MKRLFIVIIAAMALTASAFAQGRAGGPPHGIMRTGGPGFGGPPAGDPVADYLQLSADQKTAWATAHQEFGDSVQAIQDQIRAAHDQIKTLMDAKSTDAAAIGTLMIQVRTLNDQIKSAHDALDTKLKSILTADQAAKYAAFEAALDFLRQQQGPRQGGPGGPGGN